MSGPQNFQHKFRVNGPAAKISKPPTRTAVSCLPCRTRKLKCNRGQPCESCVSRGCQEACSYSSSKPVNGQAANGKDKVKTQERIDRLEALVLDLARRTPESLTSSSLQEAEATRELLASAEGSFGDDAHIRNHQKYVGATHFEAILNSIEELRAETRDEAKHFEPPVTSEKQPSLFYCPHYDDLSLILQNLPSRAHVDGLVPVYFNSRFAKLPSIHGPSWLRMYERFWQDPYSVPVLWIGQLFAVLCLASSLLVMNDPQSRPHEGDRTVEKSYLAVSARCLHLAGYIQPGPYVVETLLMYAQCKFWIERNPAGEVWVMMALITSVALRAGYHRDPSHFSELSLFEGEMRRRTFLTIRQFDILGAWQLGLRANVQAAWADVQKPQNLHDEDFDVDTKVMPPSRPDDDVGPVLFEIAKDDLYRIIERVLWEQLRSRHMPEDMVWQLDYDLHTTFEKIPATLKLPPGGFAPPGDTPHLIFMKIKTSLVFNKGLCALHRANMNTRNRSQGQSMTKCVQAANSMLHDMVYVFEESGHGGRLWRDRWMRTSLHSSDFFYAASVLCWVMCTKKAGADLECPLMENQKDRVFRNLQSAQQICENQAKSSPEARQVSRALRFIFAKSGISVPYKPLTMTTFDEPIQDEPSPETGSNSSGVVDSTDADPALTQGPLSSMFQDPLQGVDWGALDQYLLSIEHPQSFDLSTMGVQGFDPLAMNNLSLQPSQPPEATMHSGGLASFATRAFPKA